MYNNMVYLRWIYLVNNHLKKLTLPMTSSV